MSRFRADRLAELRKRRGLSQEELARRTGSTQPSITRLEAGGTDRPRNLVALARELHCTPEYLLGETDDPNPVALKIDVEALDARDAARLDTDIVQLREVDLQYGMGATYLDVPITTEMRTFSREWLRGFTKAPPEVLFWATGDGDSMEPTIRAGETFLIDTSQRTPRMADGIWALALGEIGMVKRLSFQGGGFIELHSDNPLVRPVPVSEDELHVIGRVIAVVRRL